MSSDYLNFGSEMEYLCNLLWETLPWQGLGPGDVQRSLPTQQFCDSVHFSLLGHHPLVLHCFWMSCLHQKNLLFASGAVVRVVPQGVSVSLLALSGHVTEPL